MAPCSDVEETFDLPAHFKYISAVLDGKALT
jgi:hypothetical protein